MNLVLPRPHPAQYQVLRESRRLNVICSGRRWGKTTIAIDRLVRPALTGKPVAWFAPIYKDLAEVWRAVEKVLEPITIRKNSQDRWVQVRGGGTVECWSLDDPGAARGRKFARIVIDEAAKVPNLEDAWNLGLRPMLADYQGGAWIISTPKGTANYFYNLWQRGQDPLQAEWKSWQLPTSNNPYIPAAEIESMKSDMTDLAFAQEVQAQWVSWAGAVFRRIVAAVRPMKPELAAMIGVDWGRTGDYTVFVAFDRLGQLVATDRFRGIEYSLQRDRLGAFWKRLGGKAWILAEANSMGGPVVEQLQRDKLPVIGFVTTNASKAGIIQALALAFERDAITIPDDPVLIGELQAFEGKPMAGGLMRYGAPAGVHDDCVMACAIAWAGLTAPEQRQQFLNPRTGAWGSAPVPYQISPI